MAASKLAFPIILFLLLAACSSETEEEGDGRTLRTEVNEYGLITCSSATDTTTCFTHRAILGVSMGASGAGQLAFQYPELFDTVGMLGSPLVDWTYMLRSLRRSYLGGFCSMDQILQNLPDIATSTGAAFCGSPPPQVELTPDGKVVEVSQNYNHWYRGEEEGRGGNFGREDLRETLQDLALSFGNSMYYNESSPYYPPGLPMDYRSWSDREKCDQPYVVKGLKHKEYNPDGTYDVIAFCDTDTNEGDFLQHRPSEVPLEVALAVDYNQNGIRDYAEPIITFFSERFEDTGVKSNDEYVWHSNPTGTANNWLHDEGEPYEDYGLDGVENTGDYGEGNGKFDYNPNVLNYFAQNPRMLVDSLPMEHLERLNIWADGGLYDFLMSAAAMNCFWGTLQSRLGNQARDYTMLNGLLPGEDKFDFLKVDYSPNGIGKHAYLRYGDPDADARKRATGDGNHVGTANQVLNRFFTALSFVQDRFVDPDRNAVEVGSVTDLIKPKSFFSEALQEEREFGIVLPPGYAEHPDQTYPVAYFLHGQGMESDNLLASGILFFGFMAGSTIEDTIRRKESDWAKFILVFPDSTCSRDLCNTGNFNANHRGLDGNGPRYFDSLLELMAIIEKDYRVSQPVEVRKDTLED